jgi:amino acid transporter
MAQVPLLRASGEAHAPPDLNFVGWGSQSTMQVARSRRGDLYARSERPPADDAPPPVAHTASLGQVLSTSIAGNDLLSSCLYTGGICASYAGPLAPIALLLVSVMLYFFRGVYGEVVTAMPINGGSYTALTNTTSKKIAAIAACMSIISYIATAVVSAESAVQYLQLDSPLYIKAIDNDAGTLVGTVIVLGIFALLNLLGMAESAGVATAMFVMHVIALSILIVWSLVYAIRDDWAVFLANVKAPFPDGANWATALFFGYAAALLGITGFETAANYVEEMKDSVTYVRTLRNMWVLVAFFNPVLGALSMAVLPLDEIYNYPANLLGPVAKRCGGDALEAFIVADGVIVLCGSVLTAYVGIVGLVKRMAMDRCLPDFLLSTNSLRGTNHWIIVGFFGVASSLVCLLNGDVEMLGSVYNIAFLSVMTAFAAACLVLKFKRPRLPRLVVARPISVMIAIAFVVTGLMGNIVRAPIVLAWFFVYFGVVALVVFTMFNRTNLIRFLIRITSSVLQTEEEREITERTRDLLVESHQIKEDVLSMLPAESSAQRIDNPRRSFSEEGGGFAINRLDLEEFGTRLNERLDKSGLDREATGKVRIVDARKRKSSGSVRRWILEGLYDRWERINSTALVYFCKFGDLTTLNKAVRYVRENEQTALLVVVHIVDDSEVVINARGDATDFSESSVFPDVPPLSSDVRLLMSNVAIIDALYPSLRVNCLVVRGTSFGPLAIRWVAQHLGIRTNSMFMAMPDEYFPHRFSSLGGVRVITKASGVDARTRNLAHGREVLLSVAHDIAL